MADAPPIAVAFIARDKFSSALASLERLYAYAGAPFRLYFVDGAYPAPVRPQIDAFLSRQVNVVRIAAERFLYPSEALNLVLGQSVEPRLFVLQNDVLIGRGTLALLYDAMETVGADFTLPVVLDIEQGHPALHRGKDESTVFVERDGLIHGVSEQAERRKNGFRQIEFFEMHSFLARTEALRAVAPLAPLNMHEHVDLCLDLWRRDSTAYLDDRARVLYVGSPPLPLRDYEQRFFRFRWDPARARLSDGYVRARWPIAELFEPPRYIEHQHRVLAPEAVLSRYDSAFDADRWPVDLPIA